MTSMCLLNRMCFLTRMGTYIAAVLDCLMSIDRQFDPIVLRKVVSCLHEPAFHVSTNQHFNTGPVVNYSVEYSVQCCAKLIYVSVLFNRKLIQTVSIFVTE